MHAFDYISVLFSFVYAAAVVHVLATAGDIAIAFNRIRFSWLNAGWMLASLLAVAAWWIGVWDLRGIGVWTMPSVGFFFAVACLMYLEVRLVCPRIVGDGEADLISFHLTEGRKYIGAYCLIMLVTAATNAFFADGSATWVAQNYAIVPMAIGSFAAAIFITTRWVQVAAVLVQLAMWCFYFTAFQPALAG